MYIIIAGGGKIAEYLAQTMLREGHEVAVIEKRAEVVEELADSLTGRVMIVHGDCCDSSILEDAGVRDAEIFVATTGRDDDNLVACEVAATLYKTPRIIARINNPKNERIFRKLGIEAISSTSVISRMIQEEAVQDEMGVVLNLRQGDLSMVEVEIPIEAKLSENEGGVRVADLDLPPSTVLVAVARKDELDTVNGETILRPGDTVVVCARTDVVDDVRVMLTSV